MIMTDTLKFLIMRVIFVLVIILLLSCSQVIEKPNILWITIEDTSPQFIGFYGNEHVKTPNLDKLAKEGIIFNNAFSSGPVCSTSRSTIITGVTTSRMGTGNHRSKYSIPGYIKGFPAYLRDNSVYTSNNNKTDYNTSKEQEIIAAAWDESSKKAGWWNRPTGQKFFSVFNFNICHQSKTMTNPWKWYKDSVLNRLAPEERTSQNEIDVPPIYRETKEMRKNLSRVYNSINLVDIEIGMLLDSLKKQGLMESTIIFFYADHGEAIPRGKSSSIGLSYRVPFFIWFPEKYKHLSPWKLGKPTDELICFEDLAPTILSMYNIQIPGYITGRAFLGEQRKSPAPYVFGVRNRIDESPDLVRTITDGQFFYTREFYPRYPSLVLQKYADVSDIVRSIRKDHDEGLLSTEQSIMLEHRDMEYLYDLKNDPWELNNLARDSAWNDKLIELRTALYNKVLDDKDVHFMPEYEIQEIAKNQNVYEYRETNNYDSKAVINAAFEATDPATPDDRLFELYTSGNKLVRFWAAVGIHNNLDVSDSHRERLKKAMKDEYPPVAIETAAIVWENFKDPESKEIIKNYALDKNDRLSLHALQMIEYMDDVPEDLIETVNQISDMRNNSINGMEYDYNINSMCDMILYRQKGRPLFIPQLKKWTDAKYLAWQK